jgi:hypothetical protein
MSEVQVATTPAKSKTEYTTVKMEDGRDVQFAGTRQVDKTSLIDVAAGTAAVRFDFRNGKTITLAASDLTAETQLTALAHGLSQKVGDEWSGTKDIEDIVLTAEAIVTRLKKDGWSAPKEAGDSLSGASVVIKAIVEATGKTVEAVKAFLDGKIEAAKARGEKLTRQELYSSFRNPASKTGQIIKRLEEEKAAKATKFSADDLLAEM